ncbi:hypothetical protein ACJMK2_036654 [Sinanodonta woodiana]|uniref:MD-2-related lipid-recognition domain-containing protein n=1 Tax=Sinanodonta woodiana TaxID=1069815 RepID=A0ABD3WJ96_SINWO
MFCLICLLLLSYFCMCAADPIKFKDCGSTATVDDVDISPCPTQPCCFKHGDNATVKIAFTSASTAKTMKAEVFGIVAGVPIPFPLPNPDGCKESGIVCPIQSGSTQTYQSTLSVLPQYPDIRLIVKWDLRDELNNLIFCIEFPLEIKD